MTQWVGAVSALHQGASRWAQTQAKGTQERLPGGRGPRQDQWEEEAKQGSWGPYQGGKTTRRGLRDMDGEATAGLGRRADEVRVGQEGSEVTRVGSGDTC